MCALDTNSLCIKICVEMRIIMELQEVLNSRRSMRSYDAEKKVTKEQLETIINAAILAPSWKNLQTSRYYCILSDEKIEEFRHKCLPEFNQNNSEGAALVVTTFVKNCVGFDIMGVRDGEAIREFFNLPENEQAVSVIAVGYGTKDAQMPKRKSVSDIAKFY